MSKYFFTLCCLLLTQILISQTTTSPSKKRLDFAKTYFELGANFYPGFTTKAIENTELVNTKNPVSASSYLSWGGFHFWGHAEFYVTFPLGQLTLDSDQKAKFELIHSVATGLRILPWAYRERKIRPYVGLSWSALDFQLAAEEELLTPTLSKDFLLVPDLGIMYGYQGFTLRLGLNYFLDRKWNYPVSVSQIESIKTPPLGFQLGLNYAFENSHDKDPAVNHRWNNYPSVSKLGHKAKRFGDFFIGAGPSLSYTLTSSSYNKQQFPFLKDRLTSTNYFDFALGYQFNKQGVFFATSFRNPKFETEGYQIKQEIQKTSLNFEICKFLTDYSGFAPYLGLNLAYDHIRYQEKGEQSSKSQVFRAWEPGITIGWDIVPGKTDEAFILRTNLRWYPFSALQIDGQDFAFDQLEYNLIQAVFYPARMKRKKR
ncbi:MAG: hypothetical protein KTR30_26570 [Saprospiraceae bacterium]|nr:hypothetical protein [Saprospiraceae bacterium]